MIKRQLAFCTPLPEPHPVSPDVKETIAAYLKLDRDRRCNPYFDSAVHTPLYSTLLAIFLHWLRPRVSLVMRGRSPIAALALALQAQRGHQVIQARQRQEREEQS